MRDFNYNQFLIGVFLAVWLSSACGKLTLDGDDSVFKTNEQLTGVNMKRIEGKISGDIVDLWELRKVSVRRSEDLVAYFVDQEIGWTSDGVTLFKTIDGGKNWKSYPIDFGGETKVTAIVFHDRSVGWVILEEEGDRGFSTDDQIKIYQTLNGGKTWELSHTLHSATRASAYVDGNDFWVIARLFIGNRPRRSEPLVIGFSGKTGSWIDVSQNLNRLNTDSGFVEGVRPLLEDFVVTNDGCLLTKNGVGTFFSSCDKGNTWTILRRTGSSAPIYLNDGWDVAEAGKFFLTFERTKGRYAGVLKFMSSDLSEELQEIVLPNLRVLKGFSKSASEHFVLSEFANEGEDYSADRLLLHTVDGGENWTIIFRDRNRVKSIQFFSNTEDVFWILNEDGNLQYLSRKSNS